jgi:hypothetical protein
MPADRLFHPRLGHSQKVLGLTLFDRWVWVIYLLAADDFGVMRASATTLKSADDTLDAESDRKVMAALERVITSGLVRAFDHQGRRFVCQLDWQHYQKVEYPRETTNPKPPEAILEEMATRDEPTRRLFDKHPGGTGRKRPKDSDAILETFAERLENDSRTNTERLENESQTTPKYTRAGARTATAKANANGSGSGGGSEGEADDGRAGRVYERIVALGTEQRQTLPTIIRPADFPKLVDLLTRYPDDALLDRILVEFWHTTDREIRAKPASLGWIVYCAPKCEAAVRGAPNGRSPGILKPPNRYDATTRGLPHA